MRYGQDNVHPRLWDWISSLSPDYLRGIRIGEQQATAKSNTIEWVRIYLKEFAISSLPALVLFALIVISLQSGRPDQIPYAVLMGIGAMLQIAFVSAFLGRRTKTYSASSLGILMRTGDPDPIVKIYADILISIGESTAGTAESRASALRELNGLMEEYVRLSRLMVRIGKEGLDQAAIEIRQIKVRIAETVDEETAESLRQSLAIAERRLVRAEQYAQFRQRLDAERLLVHQLMLELGDASRSGQTSQLDLPDLRQRLAAISARTDETERARAELDAV